MLAVVIHERGFKLTPLVLAHIRQIIRYIRLLITPILNTFLRSLRHRLVSQFCITRGILIKLTFVFIIRHNSIGGRSCSLLIVIL